MSNRPVESRARQTQQHNTHVHPRLSSEINSKKGKPRRINREHQERRSKSAQKEAFTRFARKENSSARSSKFRLPPSAAIRGLSGSAFCVSCPPPASWRRVHGSSSCLDELLESLCVPSCVSFWFRYLFTLIGARIEGSLCSWIGTGVGIKHSN